MCYRMISFLKNMNMPSDWKSCRSSNPSWDPCWKKKEDKKKKESVGWRRLLVKTHQVLFFFMYFSVCSRRTVAAAAESSEVLHSEWDHGLVTEQWSSYVALPEASSAPPTIRPDATQPPLESVTAKLSLAGWLPAGAFTLETSFWKQCGVFTSLGWIPSSGNLICPATGRKQPRYVQHSVVAPVYSRATLT